MIPGIEEFYRHIADSISDAIGEPWSVAKVEAIFFTAIPSGKRRRGLKGTMSVVAAYRNQSLPKPNRPPD